MRRLSMFLAIAIAGALAVAGCGSDDDSGNQSAAGAAGRGSDDDSGNQSAAGAAGAAATQCVGAYSDFTSTTFDEQTTSGKGCSLDGASICSNDVTHLVGTCGKSCYQRAKQDDASQAACVAPCIMQAVTSPEALGDSCVSCYVADVACARDLCFAQCGFTPDSDECAKCRADNGCASAFYGCSGLPLPTGVELGGGSAGASGSGN